jgi:hypothetical protein
VPPIVWVVDLGTAPLLFMVLGRQWCCCRDCRGILKSEIVRWGKVVEQAGIARSE